MNRSAWQALLLAVLVAATVALSVTIEHAGREVFYLPAYAVAIAVGAFATAATGIALVWRSQRVGLSMASALAAALALMGVLASLSIGLLLLVAAAGLSLIVGARARRGPRGHLGLLGGALLGLGLPLLAVIALSPPLVDCETGRAGENIFLALESDSATGSASSGAGGRTSGRVAGDGYEYEYTCRDGRLVGFDLRKE